MDNILVELIKETENELATIRDRSSMYLESSPGRQEIMGRISDLEGQLARLQKTKEEISKILASHNAESVKDLNELRKETENVLNATGNRVWQELLFIRGLGKTGERDRTRWLPSDLIKVEGFPELEAQARKQIDAATKALPSVIADLKKIEAIIGEAQNGSS